MPENGHSNGDGARPNGVQKIVLTFTPETFHIHIDLDTMSLDCAKSMLDQAGRWVDQQLRIAGLVKVQRDMQEAAKTQEIVNHIAMSGVRKG